MTDTEYPKTISFECSDERLRQNLTLSMPAENVLHIGCTDDTVQEIRTVNVDDCIFRLDFMRGPYARVCVFPNIPWNSREFMRSRWGLCTRRWEDGVLTLTYPEKAIKP